MSSADASFVVTKEYHRFTEFADRRQLTLVSGCLLR